MVQVVCAVITNAEGLLLACKRRDGSHLGGLWEFPGGKVEDGESAEDALVREIHEELGVQVVVGDALQAVEWHYETLSIRLLPYRCRMLAGNLVPTEHSELRWCHLTELNALAWAPADVPVIEELQA